LIDHDIADAECIGEPHLRAIAALARAFEDGPHPVPEDQTDIVGGKNFHELATFHNF